jgi:hypothetical protein
MSKIKLTSILKESLQEIKKKEEIKKEMSLYTRKMGKSLEKLKNLMRRDGYSV